MKDSKQIVLGLLLISTPLIIIFFIIFNSNNFFTYTLDDPYIHLELAKNFINGNFGINMSEFSAPSSSILWIFLLTPFTNLEFYLFVPFILNSIFFIITSLLLILFFRDKFQNINYGILVSLLFLFSINAYGLVFTGMEHSLHLLLTLFTTICLMNSDWFKRYNFLFYFSIIIAPLVRYEALAISFPFLIYIFISHPLERKKCILSTFLIFGFIIGYSYYLYLNLGEILPSSVMAKQDSLSKGGVLSVIENIYQNLKVYGFVFCLYISSFFHIKQKNYAFIFSIVFSMFMFLMFGKTGWYGRYEVFYITFILILFIHNIYEKFRFEPNHIYLFCLTPLMFLNLIYCTLTTPLASSNIYNQQYLVSQFVKKINKPVAVNDLGLISYFSDNYVLDLWGLGNSKALTARKNNELDYVFSLSKKYNTEILIIYTEWFSTENLSKFTHVADLYLNEKRITTASNKVSFYVSNENLISDLKNELLNFNFERNTLEISKNLIEL